MVSSVTISELTDIKNWGNAQLGDVIVVNRGVGANATGTAIYSPKLSDDITPTLSGILRLNSYSIDAGTALISQTEVSYLDGLTGNIQAQINALIVGGGTTSLVCPNGNIALNTADNILTYDTYATITPGNTTAPFVKMTSSSALSSAGIYLSCKGNASNSVIRFISDIAGSTGIVEIKPTSTAFQFFKYTSQNGGIWTFQASSSNTANCLFQLPTTLNGTLTFPNIAGTLALTSDITSAISTNNSTVVTPAINTAIASNNTTTAPSRTRCWGSFTASTGTLLTNSGITSVSRTGAGTYLVTMSTALSSSNYAVCVGGYLAAATTLDAFVGSKSTTQFIIQTNSTVNGTTATDSSLFIDFVVFSN